MAAPNGQAQAEVIRRALADAGIDASSVDYLEAHGTGTPIGDPIEITAAVSVLGHPGRRLVVGSVKSNIGHLEAAAGAAGLLKMVLALQHERIPAHLHLRQLNPLLEPLASQILIACLDAGGSLTGEHGVGLDKARHMPRMFTEDDLLAMHRVRCGFDPEGLCNPGKLFPTPRLCGEVPGPYRQHPLEREGVIDRW